jgi:hypothetical protein
MPTVAELRRFLKENRGEKCIPYSKLKKAQLLDLAVSMGYGAMPVVKKPVVSEIQTISRKRVMAPREITSIDEIKKPVVYSIQGITKRTQMKPQQATEDLIVPIDPKELQKDNMAYNQHAARYKMLTGETLPKWSEQSPEIREAYDYVDWYAAILSNVPGWIRPRRR